MKEEDVNDKNMQQNPKVKAKRAKARCVQPTDYVESKKKRLKTDYEKYQFEPKLPKRRKPAKRKGEHTYDKPWHDL